MEEIKGNKKDLYVREAHVCVRRERVSGENGKQSGKEMEQEKGKRAKPSENGPVEQNEKERRGSLTLSLESDSSQSQYNGAPSSHLLPRV